MKKRLVLAASVEQIRYPRQTALVVELNLESIVVWYLGLSLVKEGLLTSVIFSPDHGNHALELRLADSSIPPGRVDAQETESRIELAVPMTQIEYMMRLCLLYWRDGFAGVDHVDLQMTLNGSQNTGHYFKLEFADAEPPVDATEAKHRLDD